MPGIERLGDVLARKRIKGPSGRKARLEVIRSNWASLAGEKMSGHTYPTRLSRGTLIVSAEGGSWAAEFSIASRDVLERIERMLGSGAVVGINVQSRAWKRKEKVEEGAGGTVEEDEKKGAVLEGPSAESLGKAENEGVREALERLARVSRTSERSKQVEE